MSDVVVLSNRDIEALVTLDDTIAAVEAAFRQDADGLCLSYPVVREGLPAGQGTFGIKSGLITKTATLGLKAGGYWPGNWSERGLANHQSTVLLLNPTTGQPRAMLSGNLLTELRTAAAGAVAARWLARPSPRHIAVVGAGSQGRMQCLALARLYPEAVFLIWNRTGAHAEQLAGELTDRGITAEPIGTLSEAVVAADLVVTTTAATAPLVRDIWVRPGTHINAMGADTRGKQELDPALLRRAYVVVDSLAQATAIGELQHVPESIDGDYPSLAEVVSGRRPGRTTPEQVTVFDSTGVTFQDLAVAELAVRRALEQGAGIRVTL